MQKILIVEERNSTEALQYRVDEQVASYLEQGFSVRNATTSGVCTSNGSFAQVTYIATIVLDPPK